MHSPHSSQVHDEEEKRKVRENRMLTLDIDFTFKVSIMEHLHGNLVLTIILLFELLIFNDDVLFDILSR